MLINYYTVGPLQNLCYIHYVIYCPLVPCEGDVSPIPILYLGKLRSEWIR